MIGRERRRGELAEGGRGGGGRLPSRACLSRYALWVLLPLKINLNINCIFRGALTGCVAACLCMCVCERKNKLKLPKKKQEIMALCVRECVRVCVFAVIRLG